MVREVSTCLYTMTPDGYSLIDTPPQYPQVSFASPCSGHGFTFASVIGEITELAMPKALCRPWWAQSRIRMHKTLAIGRLRCYNG